MSSSSSSTREIERSKEIERTLLLLDGRNETVSNSLVHTSSRRDSKSRRILSVGSSGEVLSQSKDLSSSIGLGEGLCSTREKVMKSDQSSAVLFLRADPASTISY